MDNIEIGSDDGETINTSLSEIQAADDEVKQENGAMTPIKISISPSLDGANGLKPDREVNKLAPIKTSKNTPKIIKAEPETGISNALPTISPDGLTNPKPLSNSSQGNHSQPLEQENGVCILDEVSRGSHIAGIKDQVPGTQEDDVTEDQAAIQQKVEDMEDRIQNLESELKEVAALEIALYFVAPEHSSNSHKVHTPARRLSRLYIYACKYWSQDRRASVARNTTSGLVLVSKSCGNDVSRLTFWLSNTAILREIINQAFGSSCQSSTIAKEFEANETRSASQKWNTSSGTKTVNMKGSLQFIDDWQETGTFIAALEKIESWIFSRIVESIWWQTLTPNMQLGSSTNRGSEKSLHTSLGDQSQGNFSINLWKDAFHDALKRLCPIRSRVHECGCLPILARKVMRQCVGRLDVAMFNAILRESVHEIPTDPVSDPILDSKVLPIPAGDLSFVSGAQLKTAVGNWERWLSEYFGDNDDVKDIVETHKSFPLLNALSELLMLPKDLLMDQAIRLEVCPEISLPLVRRVLCNFSPDEFCPDPVPDVVLEAINAECVAKNKFSGGSGSSFPYTAIPIIYIPPSSSEITGKVAEASANFRFEERDAKEELDELDSCLGCVVDKLPPSPTAVISSNENEVGNSGGKIRYDLLHKVWQNV